MVLPEDLVLEVVAVLHVRSVALKWRLKTRDRLARDGRHQPLTFTEPRFRS